MITWMQRHKKYLIITIWISTIAFIGAGFVGWGQYKYGDKASAVAKVGDVEISMAELQRAYSNLYSQYAQMFQGNFDEEKAKSFGLQKQAFEQLVNQALILNLAKSYDLEVSDAELLSEIKQQKYFLKDGVFDKEVYKQVLSQNRLNMKEYEAGVRKDLLIRKTLLLLPNEVTDNEKSMIDTALGIADKINYKVLDNKDITIDTSDKVLKPFWEKMKQNFLTEASYDVEYIKQDKLTNKYDDTKISEYYNLNKTHFKDKEGKLLSLEDAKQEVISELNGKDTKKMALRTYITYKKDQLDPNIKRYNTTLSASNNPFNADVLEEVSKLTPDSYMKPKLVNDGYVTIKLLKKNSSEPKSFEAAKNDVKALYIQEQTKQKLHDLAEKELANFVGTTTDFVTVNDADKLDKLSKKEAERFLKQLFEKNSKKSYIAVSDDKVVLYNILEQKLLKTTNDGSNMIVSRLKSALFNDGLIHNLKEKYKTETFIQGL